MPIVTIKLFMENPQEKAPTAQVQMLADRLGELFHTHPRQTWVRIEIHPRVHYAENGVALAEMVYPTFVEVLKADLADPDDLAAEAEQIAAVVSAVLGCPQENTHILYLPEAANRIAFGGKLLQR